METTNPYASPQGGPQFRERHPIRVSNTIADILRVATLLYIDNFLPIALLTILFWTPLELLEAYIDFFVLAPEDVSGSYQFSMFMENVIGIIPSAGVMAIGAAALRGEEPTVKLGIVQGFAGWTRVFVTRLTVSVSVLFATILFIIPGLYLAVRTAFAEPAALLENLGGMSSPGRSFELTKGNFWRTFVVVCFVVGYTWVVALLLGLPAQFYSHWLLTAALSLMMDLLAPWPMLLLLAAYWSLAHSSSGEATQ